MNRTTECCFFGLERQSSGQMLLFLDLVIGGILSHGAIGLVCRIFLSIQSKFSRDGRREVDPAHLGQPHQVNEDITHFLTDMLSLRLTPTFN